MQDGSYLKLRELSFTYDLPESVVGHLFGGVRYARLNVSGRNLIRITPYKGSDPEVSNFGNQAIARLAIHRQRLAPELHGFFILPLEVASFTQGPFGIGLAASIIRLELLTPPTDLVSKDGYNRLFTTHGIIMVWWFLIPSIPTTLGNFLIPMMIGARDLAFPKLNLLSWYLFIAGGVIVLGAIVFGGVDTGWTFYTPFSTMSSTTNVMTAAIGIFIMGFSSILTGLNLIVTIHTMRAPGMTWFRMPLFLWATYATSMINILGTPVLAITLLLVAAERVLHLGADRVGSFQKSANSVRKWCEVCGGHLMTEHPQWQRKDVIINFLERAHAAHAHVALGVHDADLHAGRLHLLFFAEIARFTLEAGSFFSTVFWYT